MATIRRATEDRKSEAKNPGRRGIRLLKRNQMFKLQENNPEFSRSCEVYKTESNHRIELQKEYKIPQR